MIILRFLVGIFGLRPAGVDFEKLMKCFFWVMELVGFAMKNANISAVRHSLLIGIMSVNMYGIAVKCFSAKVQRQLKGGLRSVWIYYGMAGQKNC
ncbi:MAG: hypothetical protein A2Y76_11315 [Planctomycetes bacterium RBG_13_60_9]|nr:MAG: hypothetical protein A2Y76_11315 [Planctomycetes bacterium RBG_13_60_9]